MAGKSLPADFDPAVPLADERYERFARYRVMGMPRETAAWEAGFRAKGEQPVRPGNVARTDRHPAVKARKAFLAGDETEIVRDLRAFVRDGLVRTASLDVLRQFAIVDAEGKITRIDFKAWQASEYSASLSGLKLDPATGNVIDVEWERASDARSQLRDMYGFRAPRRTELTGKAGGPVQMVDVTKLSNEQLIQLESILAAAAPPGDAEAGESGDRAQDSASGEGSGDAAAKPSVDLPSNGR